MPESLVAHGLNHFLTADRLTRWRFGSVGLAATVGLAYFLAADLSVHLVLKPEGVAVFWPAAGISSGILIALGQCARWPVLAGVTAATVATQGIIAVAPVIICRLVLAFDCCFC